MSYRSNLRKRLVQCGVFDVGEFVLKSGVSSPVYIDLRKIISFPDVISELSKAIRLQQVTLDIKAEVVCGVPYTALPVASVFSVNFGLPMLMKRKEQKSYGTKKLVEGVFKKGMKCLIIEDIVSSGSSVIETADALRKEGLIISDCIVIVDRKQGGQQNLSGNGINLHSIFTINDIFDEYCCLNQVSDELTRKVQDYFANNAFIPIKSVTICNSFENRAQKCIQPVAKKLFQIIAKKKTNLCVAVDSVSSQKILDLAKILGPHICILKTHIDIVKDFSESLITNLTEIAQQYEFLLFEDRKFADIGNTVMHQYKDGVHSIEKWADIVTVHGIAGSGILNALKSCAEDKERACVLIAEMSSKGNLIDDNYTKKVVEMSKNYEDFVIGFVCQQTLSEKESVIHMFPGVGIHELTDNMGQQYKSPEEAVNNGADVIIVGRGICQASDITKTAIEYKNRAYNAYKKRISKN